MAVHDDKSKRLTEELSAYMEENNLSKSDVARLLKMTPGSLGNYMEGIANVGRKIEERLSQLGIDVFYIKTGYKEENITEKKTSRYGTSKSQNNKVSERLSTYAKKGTKTKDVLIRSLLNENTFSVMKLIHYALRFWSIVMRKSNNRLPFVLLHTCGKHVDNRTLPLKQHDRV